MPDEFPANSNAGSLAWWLHTIQYVKGDDMFLTDTFSQLPLPLGQPQIPEVNMLEINSLQEFFDRDLLLQSIAKWSDIEIDWLKEYIMHGWPCHIPNRMLPYFKSPHEYTIQAEIMYRRFLPSFLQGIFGHTFSTPYIVIVLASSVWFTWRGNISGGLASDASINVFIQRCHTCQVNARKQMSQHLISWEDTRGFLEWVHIWHRSLLHDRQYLVLINTYSKWVDILPDQWLIHIGRYHHFAFNLQVCGNSCYLGVR